MDGHTAFFQIDDALMQNKEPRSDIRAETVDFNHDNSMEDDSNNADAADDNNDAMVTKSPIENGCSPMQRLKFEKIMANGNNTNADNPSKTRKTNADADADAHPMDTPGQPDPIAAFYDLLKHNPTLFDSDIQSLQAIIALEKLKTRHNGALAHENEGINNTGPKRSFEIPKSNHTDKRTSRILASKNKNGAQAKVRSNSKQITSRSAKNAITATGSIEIPKRKIDKNKDVDDAAIDADEAEMEATEGKNRTKLISAINADDDTMDVDDDDITQYESMETTRTSADNNRGNQFPSLKKTLATFNNYLRAPLQNSSLQKAAKPVFTNTVDAMDTDGWQVSGPKRQKPKSSKTTAPQKPDAKKDATTAHRSPPAATDTVVEPATDVTMAPRDDSNVDHAPSSDASNSVGPNTNDSTADSSINTENSTKTKPNPKQKNNKNSVPSPPPSTVEHSTPSTHTYANEIPDPHAEGLNVTKWLPIRVSFKQPVQTKAKAHPHLFRLVMLLNYCALKTRTTVQFMTSKTCLILTST